MSAEPANSPWTVLRLLNWTKDHFEKRGIESPRLCAEILLAHALQCKRLELYTRFESTPPEPQLAAFREMIRQAAANKPIAYLTGVKEFFSQAFEVTPDVLIPRPETELLVERTIRIAKDDFAGKPSILDVGTGSGCIAISLAKYLPDAGLAASDISEAALAVAKQNAARLGVAVRIDFRCGDLLAPFADAAPFDLIVSNPPYIGTDDSASLPANVRDHEPHAALFAGADGLAVIRRLSTDCPARLRGGGHLLIEIAYNQADAVRRLLDDSGWRDIVTYKDDLRYERVVHARR